APKEIDAGEDRGEDCRQPDRDVRMPRSVDQLGQNRESKCQQQNVEDGERERQDPETDPVKRSMNAPPLAVRIIRCVEAVFDSLETQEGEVKDELVELSNDPVESIASPR